MWGKTPGTGVNNIQASELAKVMLALKSVSQAPALPEVPGNRREQKPAGGEEGRHPRAGAE